MKDSVVHKAGGTRSRALKSWESFFCGVKKGKRIKIYFDERDITNTIVREIALEKCTTTSQRLAADYRGSHTKSLLRLSADTISTQKAPYYSRVGTQKREVGLRLQNFRTNECC